MSKERTGLMALMFLVTCMVVTPGGLPAVPENEEAVADAAMAPEDGFDFVGLMMRVAKGWSSQDTALALSAFHPEALYTEPPNLQMYRGHDELRPFFSAVTPGSSMIWHHLWYNPGTGIGAGEYSFHKGGRDTAVHGVAVVEIRDGKITYWREYQRRGDIDFGRFHDPATKNWETTGADFRPD
jgi:hypothetical protein